MKTLLVLVGILAPWLGMCNDATAEGVEWHFESPAGIPNKLIWQTQAGWSYDLWRSDDLAGWNHVDGFPREGTGEPMEYSFVPAARGFFKIAFVQPMPDGFVLIPAGSFQMGQAGIATPVHTVEAGAFHMGKFEVVKALWDEVRVWGASHGYTDLPVGGGKAAFHPVHGINWHAMVKWCNARSEKENLTPCYTASGATYKTGTSTPDCNWNANGYRLPTEAEWEKAARGGLSGLVFHWGNTITHSQANYNSSTSYAYDVSPTRGYHPDYKTPPYPYTSPAGSFAPNAYGLYDMSGNLWESCWDWYETYQSEPQIDPRGPVSGTDRVRRGGTWSQTAEFCRSAHRRTISPTTAADYFGFRIARSSIN
jgi:formylglycine-generating enzyme required for sulfatase activity